MNFVQKRLGSFTSLSKEDKRHYISELIINNALYMFLFVAIIYIYIQKPLFLSSGSIMNIISLTAANLPIALGVAGCIVLQGTDVSAGRIVGLTACVAASLLQKSEYASKMFPDLDTMPILVVFLIVVAVGASLGSMNGLCISKLSLHPFIVTLATQLITYGLILMYLNIGSNNGQAISGLSADFTNFIKGTVSVGSISIPYYVFYAIVITAIMWFVWNKTTFGKNMFAVGSNPEAAHVSGVNVKRITVLVFTLAGALYAITGFIESARIGSNSSITGLNYELDAIAACVIGGVSFVGGIGKIRGVIIGVMLLRIIFVGLTFLSIPNEMQYIIKGLIIIVACAIDMRKYLAKK